MAAPVQSVQEPQSTRALLMVRPASFGSNPQTAASNAFQHAAAGTATEWQGLALAEFEDVARALQRAGAEVLISEDTRSPAKPDAIFPNNWVSFHADGTVVLYPMLAPNRRLERREDVLEQVLRNGRFRVSRTIDLTHREAEGKFLEGTGSLVLDRAHRVAYASLSPRTHLDVLGEFAQALDYELVTFEAHDGAGQPVYHTNVAMAIGTRFAVICGEAISEASHRGAVFDKLRADGHEVIDISLRQMLEFAGNVLEIAGAGGSLVALSTTAWRGLEAAQRRALEAQAQVVPVSIPTIERIGGGGVRCMLAELHLPRAPEGRAGHP